MVTTTRISQDAGRHLAGAARALRRVVGVLAAFAVIVLPVVTPPQAEPPRPIAAAEPQAPEPHLAVQPQPARQAQYARLVVPLAPPPAALIAIVIDDLGLNRRATERAIRLQAPLTLAFLPYGRHVRAQAAVARAAGHELLVHIPMEAVGGENPGPNTLYARLSPAENQRRLLWGLAQFDGYAGINNHMGSRFTAERASLAPVFAILKQRRLVFLDSLTNPASVAGALAQAYGVAAAARDVFLDNDPAPAAVADRLRDVEGIARRRGSAIAIGHPHASTLAALERWLPGLAARGFHLTTVSALARADGTLEDRPQRLLVDAQP